MSAGNDLTVGKLAIEVAANLDQLDKDLERARKLAEKKGGDVGEAIKGGAEKGAKGLVEATKAGTATGGMLDKLFGLAKKAAGALAVLFGIEKIRQFAVEAVAAYKAVEGSVARLNAMIAANAGAVQRSGEQLFAFSRRLQRETLFSAEEIERSMAQLLTYHSIVGKTYERTLRVATDLSTIFGGLTQSTEAIARALDDPVQGLAMLSKQGFKFEDSLLKQIKHLVEQNRLYEAQDLILRDLESQVGNVARKVKTDYTGATDDAGKAWLTYKETAGKAISSLIIGPIRDLTRALQAMTELMMDPLDRAIARMERLGVAAEHTALKVAQLTIEQGKKDAAKIEKELANPTGYGKELRSLTLPELLERQQKQRQRYADIQTGKAKLEGRETMRGLDNELTQIEELITKHRALAAAKKEVASAQASIARLTKDSDIQSEIEANQIVIDQLNQRTAATYEEGQAIVAQRKALEARNAELEKQKSGYVAPEKPGPHIETDEEKKKREQLEKDRKAFIDDLRGQLAALTASAEDDLALHLEQMERRIRALYGDAWPKAVREGFDKIRKAQQEALELDRVQERIDGLSNIENPRTRAKALEREIEALDKYAATLDAGSTSLKRAIDMLARYGTQLRQARKEIEAEAEAVVKAEKDKAEARKKAQEEEIRRRREQLQELRDRARTLEENARAAVQFAEGIGLIDDQSARALQSVAQLGAAIARIAGGDLSAIPSAIGSAVSLLGSITGDSPAEKERKAIMERNTEALKRLSMDLGALRPTSTNYASAEGLANRILGDFTTGKRMKYGKGYDDLFKSRYGMSLTELEEVGKKLDITIKDKDGYILKSEVEKLVEALDLARKGLVGFGESLAERRLAAELDDDLNDRPTDAAHKLAREFKILADMAPEMAKKFGLAGVDLSTSAGQNALREALRAMLAAFTDRTLDMGGLERSEFLDLIRTLGGLLDDLGEGGGIIGEGAQTRLAIGITEMQSNTLLAYQGTLVHQGAITNDHLAAIRALLGGQTLPGTAAPSPEAAGVGARVARPGGGQLIVIEGGLNVGLTLAGVGGTAGDAAEVGRQAGSAFGEAFSERLGAKFRAAGLQHPRFTTDQDRRINR